MAKSTLKNHANSYLLFFKLCFVALICVMLSLSPQGTDQTVDARASAHNDRRARPARDATIPSKAPTNADAAPRSPPLAPSPLHARISRFGRACPYPRPFMLPASEQPPSVGALLGPAPPASRGARRSPHPGAGSSRVRGFEKWRRRRRRRRQTDRRRIARVSGVLVRARACL